MVSAAAVLSLFALAVPEPGGPEEVASRQIQAFLAAELAEQGVDVISQDDVVRAVGLEAAREAMGCQQDWACIGKVAQTVDVRYLVTGRLSRAGQELTLLLVMLDTQNGRTIDRAIVSAAEVSGLLGELDGAARSLANALPAPPPPPNAAAGPELPSEPVPPSPAPRVLVFGIDLDKGVLKPVQDVVVDAPDRAPQAAELGRALTAAVSTTVQQREGLEVISREDVVRALDGGADAEACLSDPACLEDLAGALNAREVLLTQVSSLDGIPVVSVTVFDTAEARAGQRLVEKAATLDDVDDVTTTLARRARLRAGRVLVSQVEVDPAVFPLEEDFALSPVPLALVQLAAGAGAAAVLTLVPGLSCVAFPLLPGIGALLQVYLGNSLGQRRAKIFWPVLIGYLAWFPIFGAFPVLSLGILGVRLLVLGSAYGFSTDDQVAAASTFLLPLVLLFVAGLVSQAAVTLAFALGAQHPRSDVDEFGVDIVADARPSSTPTVTPPPPRRRPYERRLAMTF